MYGNLIFKIVNGVKTFSVAPDDPTLVVELPKLLFLPYISGRPVSFYTGNESYFNANITFNLLTPSERIGKLNNPLFIQYSLPEGYFGSNESQQDADDQALSFISGFTGNTYDYILSFEDKPGTTNGQLIFTNELKLENNPRIVDFAYDNSNNLGITIGKELFYDLDGFNSLLDGYYAESGDTYYRTFYYILFDIQE